MSRENLREQLANFYAGKSLRPEAAGRLEALARADFAGTQRAAGLRGPKHWSRTSMGVAACAAIVLLSVSHYAVYQAGHTRVAAVDSVAPGGIKGAKPLPAAEATGLPRIVAVKFHADWCRRSPVVAPIFDELTEKYGNQPVIFVTLDITSDATREQARMLASSLGIDWVYEKPYVSGVIKLIDREQGTVLATLTETQQQPLLEGALVRALPRRP